MCAGRVRERAALNMNTALTIRRRRLLSPCDVVVDCCSPVVAVVATVEVTEDDCSSSSPTLSCPYVLQRARSVGSRHVARLPSDHAVAWIPPSCEVLRETVIDIMLGIGVDGGTVWSHTCSSYATRNMICESHDAHSVGLSTVYSDLLHGYTDKCSKL